MLEIKSERGLVMYRIYMVEDDPLIAKTVKNHLESWDYTVTVVEDFSNVAAEAMACNPHLILMDIKLPTYYGYYWCQEIRKTSKVPIIFLSSASDNMITSCSFVLVRGFSVNSVGICGAPTRLVHLKI